MFGRFIDNCGAGVFNGYALRVALGADAAGVRKIFSVESYPEADSG